MEKNNTASTPNHRQGFTCLGIKSTVRVLNDILRIAAVDVCGALAARAVSLPLLLHIFIHHWLHVLVSTVGKHKKKRHMSVVSERE